MRSVKRRFPLYCLATLVAVALGFQWAVLHAVSFGSEVVSSNTKNDVSLGTALVESLKQHQNCSVCAYLNQKRSEEGNHSSRQTVNLELEGVSAPQMTVFSAKPFWASYLCGPPSVVPQFIEAVRPPPPRLSV